MMTKFCRGLRITVSGRETKGLEVRGPSRPRMGNGFPGGGHCVDLGREGTS